MNLGQILETQLGWAANQLGFRAITPVFDGASEEELQDALARAWIVREAQAAHDVETLNGANHESSADLTGQANHLGVTLGADIVKQKLPTQNYGYRALNSGDSSYGKLDERIYSQLSSEHPIDLTRYQVANGYMGKVGLISSGGASGANDFAEAVATAVINKRAGGMGLISGRKAFQRPMAEGARLLNAIQDVYLSEDVTVA